MKKVIIITLMTLLTVATSCKKEKVWSIVTGEATEITESSVVLSGTFTSGSKYTSARHGICLDGIIDGINQRKWFYVDEKGSFKVEVSGLEPGLYDWFAFVDIDNNPQNGEVKYFRPLTSQGAYVKNNYAVDLGLSVIWSAINVEAYEPKEYGDFFAWGETSKKEQYNESNYTAAEVKALDINTDPVRVRLGGTWRTPTFEEFKELKEKCNNTWTTIDDINGLRFTGVGDYSANSIFLPAAGMYYPFEIGGYSGWGTKLAYASSTVDDNEENPVWGLSFNETPRSFNLMRFKRYWGMSYRAVMDKQ